MAKKKRKRRLKRQGRVVKRVKRVCLCCDAKFNAIGKFNRLCSTCRKRFAYYNVEAGNPIGNVKRWRISSNEYSSEDILK